MVMTRSKEMVDTFQEPLESNQRQQRPRGGFKHTKETSSKSTTSSVKKGVQVEESRGSLEVTRRSTLRSRLQELQRKLPQELQRKSPQELQRKLPQELQRKLPQELSRSTIRTRSQTSMRIQEEDMSIAIESKRTEPSKSLEKAGRKVPPVRTKREKTTNTINLASVEANMRQRNNPTLMNSQARDLNNLGSSRGTLPAYYYSCRS